MSDERAQAALHAAQHAAMAAHHAAMAAQCAAIAAGAPQQHGTGGAPGQTQGPPMGYQYPGQNPYMQQQPGPHPMTVW
ncbi:hypothetical protein NZK35_08425 [Stieleria sp. ICT_E10.1]|uniref:hypothetical protein n=1 Tax=Stieleria sedimenti TaxID=2976331 RepID=UPI00217FC599|nr:hypothetical protein [Stieleria sedimenti]MCS7466666.1 hypothetical protein [Stieleria sedimenti]